MQTQTSNIDGISTRLYDRMQFDNRYGHYKNRNSIFEVCCEELSFWLMEVAPKVCFLTKKTLSLLNFRSVHNNEK